MLGSHSGAEALDLAVSQHAAVMPDSQQSKQTPDALRPLIFGHSDRVLELSALQLSSWHELNSTVSTYAPKPAAVTAAAAD